MILKAIALLNLSAGGMAALAQAYHLLSYPDFGPLLGYIAITTLLVTMSGLITWGPIKRQ